MSFNLDWTPATTHFFFSYCTFGILYCTKCVVLHIQNIIRTALFWCVQTPLLLSVFIVIHTHVTLHWHFCTNTDVQYVYSIEQNVQRFFFILYFFQNYVCPKWKYFLFDFQSRAHVCPRKTRTSLHRSTDFNSKPTAC